jgi:hypothetical protein
MFAKTLKERRLNAASIEIAASEARSPNFSNGNAE